MENAITIENVSKSFIENKVSKKVVDGVHLHIKKGEIFGLLGPNGAGKTTLLNMIIGILLQDEGTITVLGETVSKKKDVLERVGLVSPGATFHWILSPREILHFFGRAYNIPKNERMKKVAELMKTFGLEKIADKPFEQLSTGQKMRLMIARALINDPEIILLDEPTLGLDPHIAIKVRNEIKRINREKGATIVLTSHYMHEIEELADRIAFIHKGKIMDIGLVSEVKKKHFDTYELIITAAEVKGKTILERNHFIVNEKKLSKILKTEEDISASMALLHKLDMRIVDVKIKRPSLEDYFIKVMNQSFTEDEKSEKKNTDRLNEDKKDFSFSKKVER